MSKLVDLSGQQIGNWRVIQRCDPPEGKKGVWFLCECQCEAKTTRPVLAGNLANHKKDPKKGSGSCGCVGAKKIGDRRRKHGQSGNNRTPTYSVWYGIIKRCTDPKDKSYPNYGGREDNPRTVCVRWKDFANFFADMGERPDNAEIDRIDNSGGYHCGKPECPECGPLNRQPNCRWISRPENARNREDVSKFEYQGEMLTCGQIVERSGIKITPVGLLDRIRRLGLTVEEALAMPVKERKMRHLYQGKEYTTTELEKLCGIPAKTLNTRIVKYGWTVERAMTEPINEEMGVKKIIQWAGREWTLAELSAHCGVSTKILSQRIFQYGWEVDRAVQDKDFRKA